MCQLTACALQAIGAALHPGANRQVLTLVQGPPGTGKTSVIAGILAGLLHNNHFRGPGTQEAQGNGATTGPAQGAGAGAGAGSRAAGTKAASEGDAAAPAAGQALRLDWVPTKRVLVCAQSNAAIDELLARLNSRGLATGIGTARPAAMLRLGNVDAAHAAALQFHVDYALDALKGGAAAGDGTGNGNDKAAAELRQLRKRLADVAARIEAANKPGTGVLYTQLSSTARLFT